MHRKLKHLGVALISALALSAVGVSTASATVEFHSEAAPVTLTGLPEGETSFDVQFGQVKCTTLKYTGTTTTSTATTITADGLTIEGCTFAGVAATIDLNGCGFLIHLQNKVPFEANIALQCPPGAEMTATGGTKCVVHIPPQTGLSQATITNVGSGATREITAKSTGAGSITYTQTPGTGVGKCTSVSSSTGQVTGSGAVTGETDGGGFTHTGVFIA
jgi:hypothetical protein